ncbi:hypothetical protein MSSAC_2492 [Methanosarcina siciliae C2J]|uniref:Uncharacterized protein n=2 Tax=Methanosarcina siciliae TaxID=38027 RepID=A0A0E3PPE1_9EURY|nr:hypothetical protein MSSAC_2492 [Methanosarcina siciliae C2J]
MDETQFRESYKNGTLFFSPLFFSQPFEHTSAEMIRGHTKVEKRIAKMIENLLVNYPVSNWLTAQKGIGPILKGGLIAYTDPVLPKLTYAQSLWKYAGYAVVEMYQTCRKRY